jgi:hypothetical protein
MSLATTAVPSPRRLDFEPDDIPIAVASSAHEASVRSPSCAHFEFELDKGNEATKILMLEWSDSDGSSNMRYWD